MAENVPEKELTSYDEASDELTEIMKALEDDEISIDELTEKVARAAVLITFCQSKLRDTSKELDTIVGELKDENE